jgi:IS1 family transposase
MRIAAREHKNLDKLLELLKPLNIGSVYTDANYAYYERFPPEVLTMYWKKTSVIKDMVRTVSEERYPFFKDGTDA